MSNFPNRFWIQPKSCSCCSKLHVCSSTELNTSPNSSCLYQTSSPSNHLSILEYTRHYHPFSLTILSFPFHSGKLRDKYSSLLSESGEQAELLLLQISKGEKNNSLGLSLAGSEDRTVVQNSQELGGKYWAVLLICSLAPLIHLLTPHCSLCTDRFDRALRCVHLSLACWLARSLIPELVGQ